MNGPRSCWPLLDAFQELRRRDFPLGVDEYVLALRALTAGFGEASREDLLLMCQSLWAHSTDEAEQIADVLSGVLPPRFTPEVMEGPEPDATGYGEPSDGAAPGGDAADKPSAATDAAEAPASATGSRQGVGENAGGHPDSVPSDEPFGEGADYTGLWLMPNSPVDGGAVSAFARPARRTWQLDPRFDFVGTLPVTKRQTSQAWRHYRRMTRAGPRTEFDADATLARFHREGILLDAVLIPMRVNRARLLILEDVGGSMVPFQYVTRSVVEGAQHVGLSRVDVRYFHDVPRGIVFRDPDQRVAITVEETIAPFLNAGILIYSDAGAARGGMDSARVRHTAEFLTTLRRHTTAIAWLNPVPRDRWAETSAHAISNLDGGAVPMFALDHHGMISMIDALRGRGR